MWTRVLTVPASELEDLRRRAAAVNPRPWCQKLGWSRSSADPMKLLALFPALGMRRGFLLRAYEERSVKWGRAV